MYPEISYICFLVRNQKKIDKAQEEYIRLKQIKNAQIKLANQEIEQTEQAEEDQDSAAE